MGISWNRGIGNDLSSIMALVFSIIEMLSRESVVASVLGAIIGETIKADL